MAQQDIVKPIADWEKNFWSLGGLLNGKRAKRKPDGGTGKLPAAWEKANEVSVERQISKRVGKKPTRKVAKKRTAPLASKRVPHKRSR